MVPKALKARKNMAATLIQRYVRGFIHYTSIRSIINQRRLKENFEYFSNIKFTLESNAQVKIRYYWKKYKKAKKKRLDEAKKKKKKDAEKKKKKGLTSKKSVKSPPKLTKKPTAAPLSASKSENSKLVRKDSQSPSKTFRASDSFFGTNNSEVSSPDHLPIIEDGLGETDPPDENAPLEGIEENEEEEEKGDEAKKGRGFSIELHPAPEEPKRQRSRGFIEVIEQEKLEVDEERKNGPRVPSARVLKEWAPLGKEEESKEDGKHGEEGEAAAVEKAEGSEFHPDEEFERQIEEGEEGELEEEEE